jgi:hypothetical protein
MLAFLSDYRGAQRPPASRPVKPPPDPPASAPSTEPDTDASSYSSEVVEETDIDGADNLLEWEPGPAAESPPDTFWSPPTPVSAPRTGYGHPNDFRLPPARRRRPRGSIIGGVVALVALLVAGVTFFAMRANSSMASLPASQILVKSLQSARIAGSAHVVATSSQAGQTMTSNLDISNEGGIETVQFAGHSAQMVAIDGSLYMRADAALLPQIVSMSTTLAARLGNRWLSVPLATASLQQIAEEFQTGIVVDDLLTLAGPITKFGTVSHHQLALRGMVPNNPFNRGSGAGDTATMFVSTTSPYRPISIAYSDPQNGSSTFTFSNWGEQFPLTAPVDSIPLKSVDPAVSPSNSAGPPTA